MHECDCRMCAHLGSSETRSHFTSKYRCDDGRIKKGQRAVVQRYGEQCSDICLILGAMEIRYKAIPTSFT